MARWRIVALFIVILFSRPLSLLWQSQGLRQADNSSVLITIAVIIDIVTLLTCVLLGTNRLRAIVSAAFAYSVIQVSEIPIVYFIALVAKPFLNTQSLLEASAQFPSLFYCGLFFWNLIITFCCFLAARWLRVAQNNLTIKRCILYSLFFISFAVIVLVWWIDIVTNIPISFLVSLTSALLGVLLVGILLLAFYFFSRSATNKIKENVRPQKYKQYLEQLSKRELEVIEVVLAGNVSYKEIGNKLNISVNTVKTHLRHIYQTTGISNIAALLVLFHGYSSNQQPHPEITP